MNFVTFVFNKNVMDQLTAKASIQIQQPANVVFEAIIDPDEMSHYFISESSGRMEEGKALQWKFPEFPGEFEVQVGKIVANQEVNYSWDPPVNVCFTLEDQQDQSTIVRITEGSKPFTPENVEWVIQQTEGWANFLACLKAWVDHGFELRKGAFDYRPKEMGY